MTADWKGYLRQYDRLVLDFSGLANLRGNASRQDLLETILAGSWQAAVAESFGDNAAIVAGSSSDDQRSLVREWGLFEDSMRKQGRFFVFKKTHGARIIIGKLGDNNRICFVFNYISEFAEEICRTENRWLKAGTLVIGPDGEPETPDRDPGPDGRSELQKLCSPRVNPRTFTRGAIQPGVKIREGSVVVTRDRKRIVLGKLLGQGGEGRVFACDYHPEYAGDTGYVVKIYHEGMLNMLRLMKLKKMEEAPVDYPGICWPERMVYTDAGRGMPLGYLMKSVHGKDLAGIFVSADRVSKLYPGWRRRDLVSLCIFILERFQYLHIYGILVGDMRLKNIVMDEDGKPCLMDTDSAQVADIPCPVGYADYTPPEMQEVEFEKRLRSYDSESWAAAVLIFRILFFGLHPFQRIGGAESIEQDIREGLFPYPGKGDQDYSLVPWGGFASIWKNLPLQMKMYFRLVFVEGHRLSLTETLRLLKSYKQYLESGREPIADQLVYETEEDEE